MTQLDAVFLLLAVAAFIGGLWAINSVLRTSRPAAAKPNTERTVAAMLAATQPRAPTKSRQVWLAMPGQQIEYGNTGFAIALNTSGSISELYTLRDPEGRVVGRHYDLHMLKATGERFAAERDEFTNPCSDAWREFQSNTGSRRGPA